MKAIKKNLKDQILTRDKKLMVCFVCGAEYSANSGDYWDFPDDYIFKCCNKIMILTYKIIYYEMPAM